MSKEYPQNINSLISLLPNCTMVWHIEKQSVITFNRSIFSELGYPHKQDIDKWQQLIHHDDKHKFDVLSNLEEPAVFEARFRHPSDDWIWYSISANVFTNTAKEAQCEVIIAFTPLKQASKLQRSLYESNERFKSLAEASFGGIAIHDKGRIVEANLALAEMTGYNHAELIGFDGLLLIQEQQRKLVMKNIIGNFNRPYRSVGLRKDGTTYPLEIRGKNIPYKGKEVRVTEFRNIENRVQYEQAIKESEQKYRDIIEFAVDGFVLGDCNGQIISTNKRFLEITGRDRDMVVGLPIDTLFSAKTLDEKPLRFDTLASGETVVTEREIIRPNGEIVYIEMHSKQMPDSTYQAIVSDITERKKEQAELEVSEAKHKAIFNHANDAILIMDLDGFVDCNPKSKELFGCSKEELIGKKPHFFSPEFQPNGQLSEEQAASYTAKALAGESLFFEWLHVKADGTPFYAEISLSPLYLQSGTYVQLIIRDITERRKIESDLTQERLLMQNLMENVIDQIYFKDLESRFIRVSSNVVKRFGIQSADELVGKTDFDFFAKEHASAAYEREQTIIKTGKPIIAIEEKEIWTDGRITWASTSRSPFYDRKGKIIGTFGISRNITENKELQEKHRQVAERLRYVIEATNEGIWDWDVESGESFFSDRYYTMLGYRPDEFEASLQNWEDLLHPDDKEYSKIVLGKYLKENIGEFDIEFRLRTKNGEWCWINSRGKIVEHDQQGNPKRVVGSHMNITETKKAREEVELERAYFERLFEASPEGIAIVDINDCVVTCNDEFTTLFGYSPDELKEKQINDFIVPENLKDEAQALSEAVAQGGTISRETIRKRKDGSLVHVSILSSPIFFKGGTIAVYAIYRDITDRKHFEKELVSKNNEIETQNEEYRVINEELYEAKKKAEESDRLKSAFLANMSHEIRTPMNGILGFSQLLAKPDTPQESVDEYVGIIKSCGNQLLGIINDLIDISKIEANQIVISSVEVNINDMLHEQFLLFRKKAKEKGVEISYSTPLPLDKAGIITDEGRVKQVLTNLLSNALKFTSEGYVKFGYGLDGNNLNFFVKDTGIGIPPEHFETVFERFTQVDANPSQLIGGNGLGLAISKAFVNKLGGNIWIEPSGDSGVTFRFTIPYQPVIHAESDPQDETPGVNQRSFRAGVNVLVAEDDVINFQYLKELLSDYDVNIIWVKNGADAVNEAKVNSDIDIVLMDIKMPIMDGYEATAEIKKFRADLPIIAQTAYAFASDRDKALSAGCNSYVSKPIDRKQLIDLISKYV